MDSIELLTPRVLYEDNHLLVLNKKSGEIVQGDHTGQVTLLDLGKQYIKAKYDKPGNAFLGLPHRLDQPVSGAVLFARTSKALVRLNQMIFDRAITKIYWAVVKNLPPKPSDTLVHYIVRHRDKNKSYSYDNQRKNSSQAELHYRLIASGDNYHLLEINLITGRHHQIRSQLSIIGCPVKGDLKYGAPRPNPDASIHLHARYLRLMHPVKEEPVEIIAPVPDDPLWNFFERTLSDHIKPIS